MEGKELDLSSLLRSSVDEVINESNQHHQGDGSSTPDSGTSTADFNPHGGGEIHPQGGDVEMRMRIRQVRGMRREMDEVRRMVQRKYAEDIGQDTQCVTQ